MTIRRIVAVTGPPAGADTERERLRRAAHDEETGRAELGRSRNFYIIHWRSSRFIIQFKFAAINQREKQRNKIKYYASWWLWLLSWESREVWRHWRWRWRWQRSGRNKFAIPVNCHHCRHFDRRYSVYYGRNIWVSPASKAGRHWWQRPAADECRNSHPNASWPATGPTVSLPLCQKKNKNISYIKILVEKKNNFLGGISLRLLRHVVQCIKSERSQPPLEK